jgi:anti-sigma B factor antagonist
MTQDNGRIRPRVDAGLAIDVEQSGEFVLVRVRGAMDYWTVQPLREELDDALGNGPARLVLDLGGVPFVESTGLGLLLSAQRRAESSGGWVRLANPRAQLRRVLGTTNLDRRLPVYASLEAAIAATT